MSHNDNEIDSSAKKDNADQVKKLGALWKEEAVQLKKDLASRPKTVIKNKVPLRMAPTPLRKAKTTHSTQWIEEAQLRHTLGLAQSPDTDANDDLS